MIFYIIFTQNYSQDTENMIGVMFYNIAIALWVKPVQYTCVAGQLVHISFSYVGVPKTMPLSI